MGQGKQQLNFERNPCNNFRDTRCHRRTDGRTNRDFMSSADIVKQSEKLGKKIQVPITDDRHVVTIIYDTLMGTHIWGVQLHH